VCDFNRAIRAARVSLLQHLDARGALAAAGPYRWSAPELAEGLVAAFAKR
jgi:hypothetical protein